MKKVYMLDGGAECTVLKPFGKDVYAAVVSMDGVYPVVGKKAHNTGRIEYIYILDGSCICTLNGHDHVLKKGDDLTIEDGDTYVIQGTVRSLVIVKDSPGGGTQIV